MKKTLTLTTALILTLALLCAGALAASAPEPSEVVGTWYLNSMEVGGATMTPEMIGFEMTMTLNEDYSANMHVTGSEDTTVTWAITNGQVTVSSDGEEQVFDLVDGNLIMEAEGTKMVFGKEKGAAGSATADIAPVRTDAALADFDGTWKAYLVDAMGMTLPVDAMGIDMSVVIAEGKATLAMVQGDDTNNIELEATLADGVLAGTATDAESEQSMNLSFSLHEDGVLSCDFQGQMTVYFQKAVDAQ